MMSDCEEEDESYPVGMHTSFSSSSDAHWSVVADDNYLPMKRSFSEFYRGECITLESGSSDTLEMVNVNLHADCDQSDNRYASIEVPSLNWNNTLDAQVSENGNSPAISNRSNASSSKSFKVSCVQNLPSFLDPNNFPRLDQSGRVSKHSSPGMQSVASSEDSNCFGYVNIDYSKLQHVKRPAPEQHSESICSDSHSEVYSVGHADKAVLGHSEMTGARRTVSDIRNNIPSVDTMGCYAGASSTRDSTPLSPAVAGLRVELFQMKKRSPGVAKRLEATTPSKGEPSELVKDCVESSDVSVKIGTLEDGTMEYSKNSVVKSAISACTDLSSANEIEPNKNIVNVLVSTAEVIRIEGIKNASNDGLKLNVDPFCYSDVLHNAILFDSFDDCATDDQTFTLSPDQTDWESDDAYGELDEEGRTSESSVKPSSMPAVEDGLSGSDTDDHVATRHKFSQPELFATAVVGGAGCLSESEVTDFFSGTVNSSNIIERSQEDKVEQAIRDIYLAMERNRNSSVNSSEKASSPVLDGDQESVWVVRSSDSSVLAELHEDEGQQERTLCQTSAQPENHNAESLHMNGSIENDSNVARNGTMPLPTGMPTGLRDQDSLLQKYLARFSRGSRAYTALPADDSDTHSVSDALSTSRANGHLHNNSNERHRSVACRELEDSDCDQRGHVPHGLCRRGDGSPIQFDQQEACHCDEGYDFEHGVGPNMVVSGSSHVLNDRYIRRRHRSSSSASDMVIYSEEPGDYNTDDETDELLERQYCLNEKEGVLEASLDEVTGQVRKSQPREALLPDSDNRTVLIEGVLFRTRYLGSTKIMSEGNPSKAKRMMQAQEAVGQIKAPDDDGQPSTEVDLFISAEKIMVLDTGHREVIMDHALQTISYIADIGDLLVIMVRLAIKLLPSPSMSVANGTSSSSSLGDPDEDRRRRRVTICCHVFESDEVDIEHSVLSIISFLYDI